MENWIPFSGVASYGNGGMLLSQRMRLLSQRAIKQLIYNAYGGIALNRIVGEPTWIDSLPFSIDAKAEDGSIPTRAQLLEMNIHRYSGSWPAFGAKTEFD